MRQRLDATFARASGIVDAELLSDHARYLCVLVSGFLEQAVIELLVDYTRQGARREVVSHVEGGLRRRANLNASRLIDLLGGFDGGWRSDLKLYLVDQRKAAVDSVVNLRNTIAHGRHTGLTMVQIRQYYSEVRAVVEHVADLCDPE